MERKDAKEEETKAQRERPSSLFFLCVFAPLRLCVRFPVFPLCLCVGSSVPEGLQDLIGVTRRVDLGVDGQDVSVRTDDVAHPLGVGRVQGVAGAV